MSSQFVPEVEIIPLKVNEEFDLKADGTLTISFNKEIIEPNIILGDPDEYAASQANSRLLTKKYPVEEVIKLRVIDADLDDTVNKSICGQQMTEFNGK